jgi:hemerythrin superfamily protein
MGALAHAVQMLALMQTQKPSSGGESTRRSGLNTLADSIFDLLIADHRAVAGVFELLKAELEGDEPREDTCLELFAKIDALLTPHARAEEELVYPAFTASENAEDAREAVAEAFEEHALVHQVCGELKELPNFDDVWCAKAKVLMDLVEHHVREEENEMIPAARKLVHKEEALALASEFLAAKERIAADLGLPPPESLELPPPTSHQPAKA